MSNLVHPPRVAVRQANPLYALVVSVVDSLFDMLILKFAADSFDFKQECKTALELDREVAQRAANHVLPSDFGVLVVSKDLESRALAEPRIG